jgi:hypothetical protein
LELSKTGKKGIDARVMARLAYFPDGAHSEGESSDDGEGGDRVFFYGIARSGRCLDDLLAQVHGLLGKSLGRGLGNRIRGGLWHWWSPMLLKVNAE